MKYLKLLLLLLILSSCEEEITETCVDGLKNQDEVGIDCGGICSACAIEYPETGAYGENILFGSDTLLLSNRNASMRAIIPLGSSLKIELSLLAGEGWFYADLQNWTASEYIADKQLFTNLNPGIADLQLHNMDTTNVDTILIRYFENGESETKQKILIT